jgi:16S rRNA (cytidine1402-2'-O)-methyltransferase
MVDATPSVGVLYLVATPIGNLEDITHRALRVLREVDLIAAEDTRVTRKLLSHFDIHTPLTAYHAHTSEGREENLLQRLEAGAKVALVSDAGTPCVSDPGAELVAQAIQRGVKVEPVPGASALLSALVASGLPPARFVFEGFLPRTNDRRERLRDVANEARTVVLYEAPQRLTETLHDLAKECGSSRPVAVGRELTKKFEEFVRGTLAEVEAHFKQTAPRGECVLVLAGKPEGESPPDALPAPDTEALIRAALAHGLSPRDITRQIAEETGLPRNEVYALVQQIRDEG